jgi:hypothetical protein
MAKRILAGSNSTHEPSLLLTVLSVKTELSAAGVVVVIAF